MVVNIFPGSHDAALLKAGDTLKSLKKISTTDMMSTLSVTNENAAALSAELLKITSSLNEGQGTLGRLLNDEEMGADLKATVKNLKKVSGDANAVVADLKGVISEIEFEESLLYVLVNDSLAAEQFRSILVHLEEASEEINTVAENLNSVISEVKEGEGAFNHIMTDTTLVKDIDETVRNVKRGSVLLNENLEAMRENILFRGYFKKQEKKERKEAKK
jgi:phospholipid/cholesterol/gamma-HCH transport system substrate-binding protein